MFIFEDPTATVKYRTVIKVLLLVNLCLSVKLYSLSCSFTSISFLTNNMSDFCSDIIETVTFTIE